MLIEHVVRLFDWPRAKVTKTALARSSLKAGQEESVRGGGLDTHRLGRGFACGNLQAQGILRTAKPEAGVDGAAQHRFAGNGLTSNPRGWAWRPE